MMSDNPSFVPVQPSQASLYNSTQSAQAQVSGSLADSMHAALNCLVVIYINTGFG